MNKDDVVLLKGLADEGMLPRDIVTHIERAIRISNVAVRVQQHAICSIMLLVISCFLLSGAVASQFVWLKTLCAALFAVSLILSFASAVSTPKFDR